MVYFRRYKTITSSSTNLSEWNNKIKVFESKMSVAYPLGENEMFTINHGNNYFRFFERIGEMYMKVVTDSTNKIIATGCGVLRTLPNKTKAWYICDLKVAKEHRGNRIPRNMMIHSMFNLFRSRRVYGISMDTKGEENRIAKLGKTMFLKPVETLLIYSLTTEQMTKVMPILKFHRKRVSFSSLDGIKNLKLSSGKNMELLHAQWNITGKYMHPVNGYTHMFCCVSKDKMVKGLKDLGIVTDISATIVQHGMDDVDWSFVLTSEI